ncbi:rhodanese-like domain-containing protein [Paenibacillus radicis (ex Gao et al. 2016)]|uniref:Rhodanese-like domain-containing protein n=2 Tax=Paenibacillus radicis (ex Gao et al. 2016) TaxID=1737354 RepID=A0A917M7I6_9BACL|nr:rhodanese-like domain-containing protein [Paenibacillus radicis (ex Gao et al. 2016)]
MYPEITPEEVEALLNEGKQLNLIDVREIDEWESGHIKEASSLPLSELQERVNELEKDADLIIVCRSGNRSGRACEFLQAQGYKVTNMTGGMLQWQGEVEFGA